MVAAPIMADVLVVAAHPHLEHSRVNRALLDAAATLKPRDVEVRELYALYPDYLIDVGAEQARLAQARLVVWQHPLQWYGMPALMKLWLDEVFAFGWAYGPGSAALRGKDLWLVTSTGGAEGAYHPGGYNRYFFDAFLPPYEQTAALCGMRFTPPLVLHDAHRVDAATLDAHARLYASRLLSHPHWPEIADMEQPAKCDVPVGDRPETQVPGAERPEGGA